MITSDTLNALVEFERDAKPEDFQKIFGSLGNHLWAKFKRLDHHLLCLCRYLDDRNLALLAHYLSGSQ